MNKYAVFSAVVGDYDDIKQPTVVDDRFDYFLFSNDITESRIGVWQVRTIPYSNPLKTKIARWVKTHPEELLKEYEVSLWVDSNILITNQFVYDRVVQLYNDGILVSTMKHFQRNCAYEEMFEILRCGFERECVILKWGHYLRKQGYPKQNGLCETGVFYRLHASDSVSRFDSLWWQCIEKYSRRDQCSVNYVLWKLRMNWILFLPDGGSVYNSSCFLHSEHGTRNRIPQRLIWNRFEAWLIRYCYKCPKQKNRIEQLYYRLYGSPFPLLGAFISGQYYRIRYYLLKH